MSRPARFRRASLAVALLAVGCAPAASAPSPPGTAGPSPDPPATAIALQFPTPFLPANPTPPSTVFPTSTPEPAFAANLSLEDRESAPAPAERIPFSPGVTNILLLGSDRRNGTGFRDDVLILVSLDPVAQQAVLLSIPRDLWVYLPEEGMQRINSAYLIGEERDYPGGGMSLLRDALLYNLGIPADRFMRVEMQGFEQLVDTLGGIEVLVACSYTDWRLESPDAPPDERDSWELFTVAPGRVRMDGDLALWYSRARARSSDFDRSRRQQEVLRGLYRLAQQPGMLARIPAMYQALARHVTTDLTLRDLLNLAPLAAEIGPASVRSRFIGRDQVDNFRVPSSGAAVLVARPEELRALLQEAFASGSATDDSLLAGLEIELVDASRRPGWAQLAAERLAYSGVATVAVAPSGTPMEQTVLIDAHPSDDLLRRRLLERLGLGASSLSEDPDPAAASRFRLIVADDYNPCFDPTRRRSNAGG